MYVSNIELNNKWDALAPSSEAMIREYAVLPEIRFMISQVISTHAAPARALSTKIACNLSPCRNIERNQIRGRKKIKMAGCTALTALTSGLGVKASLSSQAEISVSKYRSSVRKLGKLMLSAKIEFPATVPGIVPTAEF